MKKILILAAVVAMAAVSQAASVSWKVTGVKDYAGTSLGSSKDYTAVVTIWDSDSKVVATSSDSTASFSGYSATIADLFSNGGQYSAQLVITGKDYTISSDVATFTVPEGADAEINFATGGGFDSQSAKITTGAGNWENVPEPTSGLLLLLGVAGLALKRKRA